MIVDDPRKDACYFSDKIYAQVKLALWQGKKKLTCIRHHQNAGIAGHTQFLLHRTCRKIAQLFTVYPNTIMHKDLPFFSTTFTVERLPITYSILLKTMERHHFYSPWKVYCWLPCTFLIMPQRKELSAVAQGWVTAWLEECVGIKKKKYAAAQSVIKTPRPL